MSMKEEDPVLVTHVMAQNEARVTENSASVLQGTVPISWPLNVRDGDVKENWHYWCQIWDSYEIISKLKTRSHEDHFTGIVNTSYERYMFNQRNQQVSESFDDYLTVLRGMLRMCEYGTMAKELLRDRLICDIRDDTVCKALLQKCKLDRSAYLYRYVQVCRTCSSPAEGHSRPRATGA